MLRFGGAPADKDPMSLRVPALLPRVVGIVLVALGTTATLTYAAGQGIGTTGAPTAAAPAVQATVVVPDVRNQAFVFAKGSLEDAGFSWKIAGSVHGFAANTVLSQSPEPGTKLLDTGAPLITLTLKRNGPYQQVGAPQDASPYTATPDQRADLADRVLPARQPAAAPKQAAAAKPKRAAAAKPKQAAAAPRKAAAAPAARPADFVVPGGRPEPTDEIPLTLRATKLSTWLQAHRKETNANVKYWLYQHEWIVAGARLGWWHGAEALRTLIAVDQHAQSQWGIGAKSEAAARAALGFVEARAKS
jgi:hypothetical protein